LDDPDDIDETTQPPRPTGVVVASVVTSSLGLVVAHSSQGILHFIRGAEPPAPTTFPSVVLSAIWATARAHREAAVAIEVAQFVLAGLLFVSAARVLLRVRESGWLWRQSLIGNVAVSLMAAWHHHAMVSERVHALQTVYARFGSIALPIKGHSPDEVFRMYALAQSWQSGLLAGCFLLALRYASKATTREHTD
jgi:hypothetical protein